MAPFVRVITRMAAGSIALSSISSAASYWYKLYILNRQSHYAIFLGVYILDLLQDLDY